MIPSLSRTALAAIGKHHAQLAELYAKLSEVDWDRAGSGDHPDRVVGLREAAVRIGASVSWLSRRENWQRAGGYLDVDRRVKFTETRLREYLAAAATSRNP